MFNPKSDDSTGTKMQADFLRTLASDLYTVHSISHAQIKGKLAPKEKEQALDAWKEIIRNFQSYPTNEALFQLEAQVNDAILVWKNKKRIELGGKAEQKEKNIQKIEDLYLKNVNDLDERQHVYIKFFHRLKEIIALDKMKYQLEKNDSSINIKEFKSIVDPKLKFAKAEREALKQHIRGKQTPKAGLLDLLTGRGNKYAGAVGSEQLDEIIEEQFKNETQGTFANFRYEKLKDLDDLIQKKAATVKHEGGEHKGEFKGPGQS